jgi:lysophospholipase L1-like esterase
MKTKLVIFVICAQLFLISFLGYKIQQKRKNILGAITVKPISKESINFRQSKKLKYFYEPRTDGNLSINDGFTHRINTDTLHEAREYSIEKPDNTFRIIALGDSFTFGYAVSDNDNWVRKLEQILANNCKTKSKFELLNLGVWSYDTEYALERFRRRGIKYDPDLVLWLHVYFYRINERMHPLIEKYDATIDLDYEEITKVYSEEEIVKYQKRLLTNYARDYKIPTVMCVLSTQKRSYPIFEELSSLYPKIYSQIIDYGEELRIPDDGHPSEYGHQVIAQDVYDYLIKNKLVPCN